MKIKFFVFLVALFAFSCSKDDDATPALESATPTFSQNSQTIEPPSAMAASQDDYAQMAVSYIEAANALTSFSSLFQVPAGATKSTTKITATNGRTNSTGDYIVHEWTDTQSGDKIALQVSEQADQYTWEIFLKSAGQSNYLKYIHAEEKKDKSAGLFKIYNIFDSNPSSLLLNYVWTRSGDILKIVVTEENVKVDLTINTKTKAGSVIAYVNSVKLYEMTWDAKGSGTWKYYDNGVVADSGSWTV